MGVASARFLFELGLLRAPSVEQILQIAATPGNAREKALVYFLDEYSNNNYGSSCGVFTTSVFVTLR